MRYSAALLLVPTALLTLPNPTFADPWIRITGGETPYLNRAQDLTLVADSKVAAVGYLGDGSRSWDWLVEMYATESGDLLWRDRTDVGSDRAHAVAATKSLSRGNTLTVVAGRIDGRYAVRAYRSSTGELAWQDNLPDIGDAYTVDVRRGRINVTGTAVHHDQSLNRQALQIITRSYEAKTGALLWERRIVEGDAVRVTESDGIDSSMSRKLYAMAAWVHEQGWSGPMLRVLDNETGQLKLLHRFSERVTIRDVAQHGRRTVVVGEEETASGNQARVWVFNAHRGEKLWSWEPAVAKRADAENSSAEKVALKGGRVYVAVNRWIETQCQSGPCRFGERRGAVRVARARNGDLQWEVEADCAIRDLAVNLSHVAAAGVSAVRNLASPTMCGSQLDRAAGFPVTKYGGMRGDIYAVMGSESATFVAGEIHDPYPDIVNYFVGAVGTTEGWNP